MKIFRRGRPGDGSRFRPGVLLANLVTIGVGAAAGFVSWQHLSELGKKIGATEESAFLTPFTIDGMILAGTLELRQARIEKRPAKVWAYVAVLIGVVGTIAGNVRAARAGDLTAQLYFAAPALAFLVSVEVLFGKPLSRNLWDILRGWGASYRARKQGEPVKDPKPDRPDERTEPIKAPEPEKPVKAPQSPVDGPTPRLVPTPPAPSRKAATRKPGRAAATKATPGPVVGSRTSPARLVAGAVLEGEELRADARARIHQALADGRSRDGLGAWVARQYDPEMSSRWGQERVTEVPDPQVPVTEPVIGPLPVAEEAEPLYRAWPELAPAPPADRDDRLPV